MPRQARLDAPGTLHHVILRGIARGTIVIKGDVKGDVGSKTTSGVAALFPWARAAGVS
jgi:hypothetical protein